MASAGRMIVDAQAHLWKAESDDWKWVPGRKPQLPEPFTIEKLVPLMDEAGVDRAVIVPPSWPGDRNDYALEAAKRYPNRFAVMGRIPLQKPESATLLPKWKEQPGMKGVRLTFQREQAAMLTKAPPTGSGPPPRRPACRSCSSPRTTCRSSRRSPSAIPALPSDHRPHESHRRRSATERRIARAIDDVVALAKYPNVSVKLSSAPTYSLGGLSVARHDRAHQALLRRLRSAALLLGHRPHQRASPNRPTASASRISPRNCRSCPRRTRTG